MKDRRWIGSGFWAGASVVFYLALLAFAVVVVWQTVKALNPYLQHGYGWLTLVIGAVIGFVIGAFAVERWRHR